MSDTHISPVTVDTRRIDDALDAFLYAQPGVASAARAGIHRLIAELRGRAQEPATVSDGDWQRALNCAHSVMESYNAKRHISTEEGRKRALDDAMQHGFGLLALRHAGSADHDQ